MKILLVDSNALIHRAFHSYPETLTLPDGTIINAVYGFAILLLTAIERTNPDKIICCFDTGKPTIRSTQYVDYKAHRKPLDNNLKPQFALTKELVESFEVIPIYAIDGYEADDLIGTIAKELVENDESNQVIIVTGDSDQYQLVNSRVDIFMAGRNFKDSKLMSYDDVFDKLGFKPEYITTYKAIKGDTSDNIPGVPGIGDKGATDLIKKYKTLENIYEHIAEIEKENKSIAKKLVENQQLAELSLNLATIDRNVPLEKNILKELVEFKLFDIESTEKCFLKFGFRSLISKLKKFKGDIPEDNKSKGSTDKGKSKTAKSIREENSLIESFSFGIVSQDILIGWNLKSFFKDNLSKEKLNISNVSNLYSTEDIENLFQNYYKCNKFFDLQIADFLITFGEKPDIGKVFWDHLKFIPKEKDLYNKSNYEKLYGIYTEKIKENTLEKIFNVDTYLSPILFEMETIGINIDRTSLKSLEKELNSEAQRLTQEIYTLVGHEFNVNSPKQLGTVLAEELNIPLKKKGKTKQYSTSEDELEKYIGSFDIISKVLEYRKVTKLQNTYVTAFLEITKENSIIHTTYNQTLALTGRLSSINPNLQNIPKGNKFADQIKSSFVTRNDKNILASIDYSQQELRILSHLSRETSLQEAFKTGLDIHKYTASKMYGVSYDKVNKEQRNAAKTINFGIVYGMGAQALSRSLEISLKDAKIFIDKFFEEYPKLKEYYNTLLTKSAEKGYSETIFGRKKSGKNLISTNPLLKSNAIRETMNFPIQGSASDQIKAAMIIIDQNILKKKKNVKMLLQIHDELVFEIEDAYDIEGNISSETKAILEEIKSDMENVVKLDVPVIVEIKVGQSWGSVQAIN